MTYGTKQMYGLGYLRSIVEPEGAGVRGIIGWSYRLDCIFDHYDDLRRRGRHCLAQAEFNDSFSSALSAEEFCQYFGKLV